MVATETQDSELSQRLLRYSAAAGLTIVGALALRPPTALADGIIYPGPDIILTPMADPFMPWYVDFDQNGINEFGFRVLDCIRTWPGADPTAVIDLVTFSQSVSFIGAPGGYQGQVLPFALDFGASISANAGPWIHPTYYATLTWNGTYAYWVDLPGMHYLGLRYTNAEGITNYGWMELTVTDWGDDGGPQLIVHRYGHGNKAGAGGATAVRVTNLGTDTGLRAVYVEALSALAGVMVWLRRRLPRS